MFNSEYMYSLYTHVMLKWLSITEDALFEVLVQLQDHEARLYLR